MKPLSRREGLIRKKSRYRARTRRCAGRPAPLSTIDGNTKGNPAGGHQARSPPTVTIVDARTRLANDALLRGSRPERPLVLLHDRTDALVNELLDACTVRLGDVKIAARVGDHVVGAVKLTRLSAAGPDGRELFERFTQQDVNVVVPTVGEIDVLLL